jgi:hypothetical protein
MLARAGAEFLRPQAELWVEQLLHDRSASELDDGLARAIDFLGRLRSDDAPGLIVTSGGAAYYVAGDEFRPGRPVVGHGDPTPLGGIVPERTGGAIPLGPVAGSEVRGSAVPDGGDEDGQEHPGAGVVPGGAGAPAGDRSG